MKMTAVIMDVTDEAPGVTVSAERLYVTGKSKSDAKPTVKIIVRQVFGDQQDISGRSAPLASNEASIILSRDWSIELLRQIEQAVNVKATDEAVRKAETDAQNLRRKLQWTREGLYDLRRHIREKGGTAYAEMIGLEELFKPVFDVMED